MATPEFIRPIWVDGKVTNKGGLPLWSGTIDPPAPGSIVRIIGPKLERAVVIDYRIDAGWLMVWAERLSDNKRGDLAGAEIAELEQ